MTTWNSNKLNNKNYYYNNTFPSNNTFHDAFHYDQFYQNDNVTVKHTLHSSLSSSITTTTTTTNNLLHPTNKLDTNNIKSDMPLIERLIKLMETLNLGTYTRNNEHVVSNNNSTSVVTSLSKNDFLGKQLFDFGLRLLLSYQHELAYHYFYASIQIGCPNIVFAHGLLALCHCPNYNLKGNIYYETTFHSNDVQLNDIQCHFPSQHVADRHCTIALAIIEEFKQQQHELKNQSKAINRREMPSNDRINSSISTGTSTMISDLEVQFVSAIRILCCKPGIDPALSYETVGRPYANAMRDVYHKYPYDPDIAYFFVESLMVLNAWELYDHQTGKPISSDVDEIRIVLENSLSLYPNHPGLIHMYIHLSEMSTQPERALEYCTSLRRPDVPHGGHLIHMPTHIDILIGDYEQCVRSNLNAIQADMYMMETCPTTAGCESFYFEYILHDFHMAIYGSILGAMEQIGMDIATKLNTLINESFFIENPTLVTNLEAYSATDIHILIRFGRWDQLLQIEIPKNENLMLYRTCSILYGHALALAMTGNYIEAKNVADRFDTLRNNHPKASKRMLNNNSVADLLNVDAVMLRGEIAYREGNHTEGLTLLRRAVEMEDNLKFDEPRGKMQPIRHALGGLLMEQKQLNEAENVFRKDLVLHPRNPWALVGLIRCLELQQESTSSSSCCCCCEQQESLGNSNVSYEISDLRQQLRKQRQTEWADFDVVVACECCQHPHLE